MTIKTGKKQNSPSVEIKCENSNGNIGSFMVDTGAELYIIKHKTLKSETLIDQTVKYQTFEINEQGINRMGEVKLKIYNK